jgi:hypothetical protein
MVRKKARIKSKAKHTKSKGVVSARKKTAPKKNAKTGLVRKRTAAKGTAAKRRSAPKKGTVNREEEFVRDLRGRNRSVIGVGGQAGDLQGLSRVEEADSESVDELVEEGNQFEAGAVAGVEEADSADEREVHTHEVAEDDVPEEYLDQD